MVELVLLRSKTDAFGSALMALSLFGFLGNVMIDYNWGTNLITNSIAIIYWMTLRWIIPFPVNYWGLGAVIYFALFLLSFAILNRKQSLLRNVLETVRLASFVLILFETGVYYFVPGFMDKWVINAVRYTILGYITNWDVLAASGVLMVVSQGTLMTRNPRSPAKGVRE